MFKGRAKPFLGFMFQGCIKAFKAAYAFPVISKLAYETHDVMPLKHDNNMVSKHNVHMVQ